ncbi:MAG: tetratricopeptide repeat protein, partial [Rhodospirillaceae bacterium]
PEPVKPVQHPPDPAPKRLQKSDFGDRCIDEAVTLHREGRSASAHEALHQALSIATVALKDGDVMTGAALLHRMTEVGPKLRANAITAEAHRQLGAMREDSELPEAHDHFTTALELFEAAVDKTGIAQVADHLALMHARLEDAAGAEAYYRYALAQRERSGDRETTVKTLNHLAAVVDHQDRRREAQELVERALTLAKGLKNKTLLEDTESLRKELR